jgi:hypothetical protein
MKDLKHIKRFNESEEKLNISDVSDSLKNIIKNVKRESKNKRWMGSNVHTSAFEEGKECVLNILEDILKNYH